MRVSDYFALAASQPSLEFVDVQIYGDTRVFVDPTAIGTIDSDWAAQCKFQIEDFFDTVLDAIRHDDRAAAVALLSQLSEPNETHLGLSSGRPRGSGVGGDLAEDLWASLRDSRAVDTGLVEDLADTILFVPGIGSDRISDITTNIIRDRLVEFTQDAAVYYDMPLAYDVEVGRWWDPRAHSWRSGFDRLPLVEGAKLLLVPKAIARRSLTLDPGDYYRSFIQPFLQARELDLNGPLVQRRKDGTRYVTKKSIAKAFGSGKPANVRWTEDEPQTLNRYRAEVRRSYRAPDHHDVAEQTGTPEPDWDQLLQSVTTVPPGRAGADSYHRAVQALLTALLFPALDFPHREFPIHNGRKRIDITYTNMAAPGFFAWLLTHEIPCRMIPVECKNYNETLGNPQLDQLAGRFSNLRGVFGLLLYRGYGDRAAAQARCRDTATDGRGYILLLDDLDLSTLIEERKACAKDSLPRYGLLHDKFNALL